MDIHPGTKNGVIITWMNPVTKDAVFEWDENTEWSNGPHYHVFLSNSKSHDGNHYYPGDPVPEPFNTIYFGG